MHAAPPAAALAQEDSCTRAHRSRCVCAAQGLQMLQKASKIGAAQTRCFNRQSLCLIAAQTTADMPKGSRREPCGATRNSKLSSGQAVLRPAAHLPSCPASCQHTVFKLGQMMSAQLQRSWLCVDGQHSESHKEEESCRKLQVSSREA